MNLCLDNIIFSLQRAGGISVYWSELWLRFLRDGAPVVGVEAGGAGGNIFRSSVNIPARQVRLDARRPNVGRFLSAPVFYEEDDLLHSSYYRVPSSSRVPHIQSCYDFTYERFRKGPARWVHSWQKGQALNSARGVICISKSTRDDLLYYCPLVREENTCVIHLGISDAFRQLPREEAEGVVRPFVQSGVPFILFVGDRSQYKNFPVAVDAVCQFKGFHLVIVGGGSLNREDLERLDLRLRGRWVHIDKAPSPLLNALYNCACALIYPSSYEGFGIPIIEAMAAACPVIAVAASSVPEAAGEAGLMLERPDADAVLEHLVRLEDTAFRNDVSKRGLLNAERFSWERCYQETRGFYSRAINQ